MYFDGQLDINISRAYNGQHFDKRQEFIDSEVVRLMDAYTPLDTGTLKKAPLTQTNFGSGLIIQNTPYAKLQYYTNKGKGIRGARWFERMKAQHKKDILQGALSK